MKTTIAEIEAVLPESDAAAELIIKRVEAEAVLRRAQSRHQATTRAFARSRAAVTWSPDAPAPESPEFDRLARAHDTAHRAYTEAGIAWADAEQHLLQLKRESV